MIGIICAWFNIVICVGVPTAVFAFLLKKSKQSLKIFLVGGCTYLISQVCIRQPVLSILESIDAYKIFEISNPVHLLRGKRMMGKNLSVLSRLQTMKAVN